MLDIAIVGGGLSGLSLAKRLLNTNRIFAVFESRNRFGGRIFSLLPSVKNESYTPASSKSDFKYDLGPSWIWPESQPRIAQFIGQNKIDVYSQWTSGNSLYQTDSDLPPHAYVDHTTYGAARRIKGGAYRLVETLLQLLPQQSLKLNHHLLEVNNKNDFVELHFGFESSRFIVKAKQVVITVPPRLLVNTVSFNPVLDMRMRELMKNTATWMAGHAKVVVRYPRAFWRKADFSGNVLAAYRGAVLGEIFDACSANAEQAALSGFFALPAVLRSRYRSDLEVMILDQLVSLFGREAAKPDEIIIKDWFDAQLTATRADESPPPSHPQYGHPWLQLDHWSDKLYFGGTETASQLGGYLEGALESAERVAKCLLA